MFSRDYKSVAERNLTDATGGNLLHIICKQKDAAANLSPYETAIRMLLNHQVSPLIKDCHDKMAIDYLPPTSPLRKILSSANKNSVESDLSRGNGLASNVITVFTSGLKDNISLSQQAPGSNSTDFVSKLPLGSISANDFMISEPQKIVVNNDFSILQGAKTSDAPKQTVPESKISNKNQLLSDGKTEFGLISINLYYHLKIFLMSSSF